MITGVGTDIVEISRIAAALERHGERFAERVLGVEELIKFRLRSERAPSRGVAFLATRFAAKEAFSKAIGLGMRTPMSWRAVQILNAPGGRPIIVPTPDMEAFLRERGWRAHVTVSDERLFAMACVVVEDTH